MKKSIHERHIIYSKEHDKVAQNYTNDHNIETYDFALDDSDFRFFLDLPVYREMRTFKKRLIMNLNIKKALVMLAVLGCALLIMFQITDSYWAIGLVTLGIGFVTDAVYDYFG